MYFKPERIKGEDYSVHSEVWSLGVSLFEVSSTYCNLLYCNMLIYKILHPIHFIECKSYFDSFGSAKTWYEIDSFCQKGKPERAHYQRYPCTLKNCYIYFSLRWANFPMNQ